MLRHAASRASPSLLRPRLATALPRAAVAAAPHHHFSTKPSQTRAGEAPLEQGLIEKMGLNQPSRFVPVGLGVMGFLSATGLYHWNEESQILGLFILFTGVAYAKGGDALGKMLDEMSDAVLKEHNALEDAQIASTKLAIAALEKQSEVYTDVKKLVEAVDALQAVVTETATRKARAEQMKILGVCLQFLLDREARESDRIHRQIVENATAEVRSAFTKSEVKKKALSQAIAALKSAKSGDAKDAQVSDLFLSAVRAEAAKAKSIKVDNKPLNTAALPEELKTLLRREGLGYLFEASSAEEEADVERKLKGIALA